MEENQKKYCPICGNLNDCAVENRANPRTCWCMTEGIPTELRKIAENQGKAKSCICKSCVEQYKKGYLLQKNNKKGVDGCNGR